MVRISLFVIFTVLFLASCITYADSRLDNMQIAWASGDILGVQQDINRSMPREMAEAAVTAEKGGIITKTVQLDERTYAARVSLPKGDTVIVLQDCAENPKQFCFFGHRELTRIGGAEYGQLADVGTTAIGILGMGASEANPIGLPLIMAMKGGFLMGSRTTPNFMECVEMRTGLDMFGYGPALGNAATLLAGTGMGISLGITALVAFMRYEEANESAVYECAGFALEA